MSLFNIVETIGRTIGPCELKWTICNTQKNYFESRSYPERELKLLDDEAEATSLNARHQGDANELLYTVLNTTQCWLTSSSCIRVTTL